MSTSRYRLSYKLLIQHERSERSGSLFDVVHADLDAIAMMTGMEDVFALRAVDIFRVLDVSEVPSRGTTSPG